MTNVQTAINHDLPDFYRDEIGMKNWNRLNRLIDIANSDLYHGPAMRRNGFVAVCRAISTYFEQFPLPAYYDYQSGEFLDRLPEAEVIDGEWIEPFYEDIYELDNPLRSIVGRELSVYINRF